MKIKRAKKCMYCTKPLREWNQSGICSSCRNAHRFELSSKGLPDVKVL